MPQNHSILVAARTHVRFGVLAWLCALAMIAYLHRSCISVAAQPIQHSLCITSQQMAWVFSAFLLGYFIFQIPSGRLGDRWGTRFALPIFVIIWSTANGLLGLAAGLLGLLVSRFVNGVAQAGIFPCSVNTISQWFPASEKAMPSGLLGAFMSVGAIVGSALTGMLLVWLDWPVVFFLYAIPGLLAAAWFYSWFRDSPREHPRVSHAEVQTIVEKTTATETVPESESFSWLNLLTSANMWLICGQQFFRAAGYFFYLSWFPTFLQESRSVSLAMSGVLTSLPLLGVVIGSSSGGFIMDVVYRRTQNKEFSRKGMAIFCLFLNAVLVMIAYFVEDALLAVAVISLGSLFSGMAGPAGYTITIDVGGRNVATVFSTMNMAGNIGAFLTPIVFERAAQWSGWNSVLWWMTGIYILAAICWMLIDVHRPIFADKETVVK